MKSSNRQIFRYISLSVVIIVSILLFAGCNDESIKVMFDKYEQEGGRIQDLKTVAVLDFGGKNQGIGPEVADDLADRLEYMGYMKVIDRNETLNRLRENGLPVSGSITNEDARQISKILGVDALVYGNVDAGFVSTIKYRTRYTEPEYYYTTSKTGRSVRRYRSVPRVYTPYLNRSGSVTMKIHFYDARISREIGVIDLRKNYSRDYDHYYTSASFIERYFFDSRYNTAMPSDEEMLVLLAERSVESFINGFTPHYVSRVRKLQEGVPGADRALTGKWNDARDAWEKYIQFSPHNWQVNVNLGIFHERNGNPIRALAYYQAALADNPGDPELQRYVEEAGRAAGVKRTLLPVSINEDTVGCRISEIKEDGRVYINAGTEDGIQPGDSFTILRERLALDKDLTTPTGKVYHPEGVLVIEKVFEGVSWGYVTVSSPGKRPSVGDIAVKKSE
jgi:tetratricopeptide (TPR) repeat protein